MHARRRLRSGVLLLALAGVVPVVAQERHDPAASLAAQREGMVALQAMNGVWRGPAWTLLPNGQTAR
jgi:hypothetical protein